MSVPVFSVLVVGCGNIAGGLDESAPAPGPWTHAGAFTAHPGFRLAACVEPAPERRQRFMRHWGVERGYSDWTGVATGSTRFDVISICSPTHAHATDLDQALRLQPRLIFCEKPLSDSVAAAQRMVQACVAAEVLLAVNHTRRWAPDMIRLRRELQEGHWGAVRSVTCWYNKGILNNGSHMLDLLRFLLGELEVVAVGRPVWDFWQDDPTIPALLECGPVQIQLAAGDARDYALFEMTIVTAQAMLVIEDGGMRRSVRHAGDSAYFPGYRGLSEAVRGEGGYKAALPGAVNNIHAALVEDQPLASTGESALGTQRLGCLIRELALEKFA